MAAKKKKIVKPVVKAKAAKPAPKAKKAKAAPKPKIQAKKVAAKKPAPPVKKAEEKKPAKAPAKPAVEAKKTRVEETPPAALVETVVEVVEVAAEAEEVILTDSDGRRFCRVKDCDQVASVDTYCRYHYLLYWKKIQVRKKILSEGKLERYIEELTARYPDKFLDMLRKDLRSEKEFLAAIQELEIDESTAENEFEDEAQTYIDEVRGISESTPAREEEEF